MYTGVPVCGYLCVYGMHAPMCKYVQRLWVYLPPYWLLLLLLLLLFETGSLDDLELAR